MLTKLASEQATLPLACHILKADGVIILPTDTVYGIGCDAWSQPGIRKLFELKHRSLGKSIPILIGELCQLDQVTNTISPAGKLLAEAFWPGALTLVLPKHPGLPAGLSADDTIGIRFPDHPFTSALLVQAGPMAVTSANLSGMGNTTSAAQARAQLNVHIDLLIDGGETPGPVASTVVDCTTARPRILRPGVISVDEIRQTLTARQISLEE